MEAEEATAEVVEVTAVGRAATEAVAVTNNRIIWSSMHLNLVT